MPVVPDNDLQVMGDRLKGMPEFNDDSPSTMELALATFRTENSVGSLISRAGVSGLPNNTIENRDFNPWDSFTEEERLDERFMDNALLADSEGELNSVRQLTLKERKDRDTISRGGALSFGMGLGIGGIADPINLIPIGGTAMKTYKAGSSILKGGMVTGSVASLSTAIQETALHATQLERTYGESAVNVTASFLLGGALGMGLEQLGKIGATDKTFKEIEDVMNVEGKIRDGVDSIGAARVMDDFEVKGNFVKKFVDFIGFDPLSRTVTSLSAATRRISNGLAENPIAGEKGNITAVESRIKIKDGLYVSALTGHLDQYKGLVKRLGQTKMDQFLRRGTTRKDFNEMVSKEIRNPQSQIPEVKAAAQKWMDELYTPLKNQAIEAKLLPEDVDVKTAVNYLNRAWNKEKLIRNMDGPDGFVAVVSKWLDDEHISFQGKAAQALQELKTAKGARKTELEAMVKKADFKEKLDLEKQDFDDIARQIAQRISGTPDGRLPYDWKLGDESNKIGSKVSSTSLKGPLKARTFNIPDELIEKFLENDIEVLGSRYLKQLAPDIELAKAFDGDISMTAQMEEIQADWTKIIDAEKNPKKKSTLTKEMESDIRDVAAMRDRIRGTYGQVADPNNPWVRAGRSIRDLNYLRFMGGVVPSSIPDVARTFMAEGFVKTFKNGLIPLMKNLDGFKVAAEEAKRYGIISQKLMGGRSEIMADVADYTRGGNAFERLTQSAAASFGKINLMDRWTDAMKTLHVVTMQNGVVGDLMKGKYDNRLSRLGIDEANAKNIAEQVKKHGGQVDGVWTTGAKNWDSPELEQIWGAALRKESDRVIVMPGQEKPLFMSTEMGKTVFQFRSFMFSATQRMLIGGMQGQEANYFGGFLMLTGLGMLSTTFKNWDAGRKTETDPTAFILEGIDRSGSLGFLMEINNTIEKISENNHGLRPYLGAKLPASRYASRNKLESILGPTFGSFASTALVVASAGAKEKEWSESDTRALRRLLPYQNLMILRQAFDKLEGR
jgi:hypothetical protein